MSPLSLLRVKLPLDGVEALLVRCLQARELLVEDLLHAGLVLRVLWWGFGGNVLENPLVICCGLFLFFVFLVDNLMVTK